MRSFFILSLIFIITTLSSAFSTINNPKKRGLIGSKSGYRHTTCLSAAASGGAPKKKAAKKAKKAAVKEEDDETDEGVITFRKPEFVSRIAEKTGMSKSDSEAALSAVLETITEVG